MSGVLLLLDRGSLDSVSSLVDNYCHQCCGNEWWQHQQCWKLWHYLIGQIGLFARARLRWIDVNTDARTVNIRPVKNHDARVLRVSDEFLRRLGTIPRQSEYIFNYEGVRTSFDHSKRTMARKLGNPRLLSISFTTFRHWKGTLEYHKTHDILHVKELLGHKNIRNTLVYINLERAIFATIDNNFHVKVAKTAEEACQLVEVGFEYVTGEYNDGGKIFRKRK